MTSTRAGELPPLDVTESEHERSGGDKIVAELFCRERQLRAAEAKLRAVSGVLKRIGYHPALVTELRTILES